MMRNNEKFIAFVLLGASLVGISTMVYLHPLPDSNSNSAALQIINSITGALTLAFGGAANALFRITSAGERQVTVTNPPEAPVNVSETPESGAGS